MIDVIDDLIRSFLVLDVFDPDELGDDSRVSERFPSYNKFNTYRLRQAGQQKYRQNELLSRLAFRRLGNLTLAYIADRFGTDVGIIGNGIERMCLSFPLQGTVELAAGPNGTAVAHSARGIVLRGLPGTRILTGDDSARFNIWIDEVRLTRALQVQLDAEVRHPLVFVPSVDWDGQAAPIARLVSHLVTELADPAGLLSTPHALESFTDTLAHLMLERLQHNYTARLGTSPNPAKPWHLRRAEAFIHAHAQQATTIAEIAQAAGCSTRTLQSAFRQFRDITPLTAVMEARLQAARHSLRSADRTEPTPLVVRRLGFTNLSRFRAAYRRRFGEDVEQTRSSR